jgi:MFS family permease
MFLLVFAIQEGQNENWDALIWAMIAAGVVVFVGFVIWQRFNRREPLVPLGLFRDRNFSLSNTAITAVGFAVTAMSFPIMLYAQDVLGLSPLRAALLLVPMAVFAGALAPWVGKLSDRMHPRYVAGVGLLVCPIALVWLASVMTPAAAIWELELPIGLLGVGNGFLWSPLSTTVTRNLPMSQAGAGSGVYNATRQFGSVLGSAAIAVLMQSRLGANGLSASAGAGAGRLPAFLHDGFSTAMSQSLLLPAGILLIGFVAVLFYARPAHMRRAAAPPSTEAVPATMA